MNRINAIYELLSKKQKSLLNKVIARTFVVNPKRQKRDIVTSSVLSLSKLVGEKRIIEMRVRYYAKPTPFQMEAIIDAAGVLKAFCIKKDENGLVLDPYFFK